MDNIKLSIQHNRKDNEDKLSLHKDGDYAGTVSIKYYEDTPELVYLHSLFIEPEYREHGLGKELMSMAERYIKERGHDWIYLEPDKSDEDKLIGYYKKQGYEISGHDKDEQDREVAIMRKHT